MWMGWWLGLVPATVGLVLIWRGLRTRRRGSVPHCRACEYNLTGLTSERCPECGATIGAVGIVHGEARRRPGLALIGLLCVVLGGTPLLPVVRQTDWYPYKPSGWVLKDLQSPNVGVARRAWQELQRRSKAGRLSIAQNGKLIDVCLKKQGGGQPAGPPGVGTMVDYLGLCFLDGLLSDAQSKTFFDQIVLLELAVRPQVVVGDRVACRVSWRSRCPSASFWVVLEGNEMSLDGKVMARALGVSGQSSGSGGGGSSVSSFACDTPGKHTLSGTVEVTLYDGTFGDPDRSRRLHQGRRSVQATFEVLETAPPDHLMLIDDPSQEASLHACIKPVRVRCNSGQKGRPLDCEISIEIEAPPVNIAFDVIMRVDGAEHDLGSIHKKQGESTSWGVSGAYDGPVPETCDIILRSNVDILRRTVEMSRAWKGELVYPNLPVEHKRPVSQPGS